MQDDDIRAILAAELDQDIFEIALLSHGLEYTGDNVSDFKRMADAMSVDAEDLLYALFVEEEDIFDEETWTNLTVDE
jgi:hypothetical protein